MTRLSPFPLHSHQVAENMGAHVTRARTHTHTAAHLLHALLNCTADLCLALIWSYQQEICTDYVLISHVIQQEVAPHHNAPHNASHTCTHTHSLTHTQPDIYESDFYWDSVNPRLLIWKFTEQIDSLTSQMMAMFCLIRFSQRPLDGAMVHGKKRLLFSYHLTL